MRRVDWLRSARTEQLQVRESPQPKREAPTGRPIEIVFSAFAASALRQQVAELLIAAEQAPGALYIAGVSIVAFGKVIERITGKDLQRISSEGGQLGPAKFVLTRAGQAGANTALENAGMTSSRLLREEALLDLPFDLQKPTEVLVVGKVRMQLGGKTAATFLPMEVRKER